jgi:TM2 domain-containing membrane protein YozV
MSDVTLPVPAGWYPDPHTGQQRWWDGQQWGAYASYPPTPPAVVVVHQRPLKDVGIAYVLAIFLGGFGAHNFYVGNMAPAVIQLVLTAIGILSSWFLLGFLFLFAVLVWVIVDLFLIPGYVRTANARITAGY